MRFRARLALYGATVTAIAMLGFGILLGILVGQSAPADQQKDLLAIAEETASGLADLTARVILDPADPRDLEPGEILVAPLTDPAWTPLFMAAGGVVVDVGGQISHAIIVSRELGLPCVVSATDATKRIPDGAQIEVNGDTGQVTVL